MYCSMRILKICFSLILIFGLIFQNKAPFLSHSETLAPKGKAWEEDEPNKEELLSNLIEELHDFFNKRATFVLFVVDEIFKNDEIAKSFPKKLTSEMNRFISSIPHFNNGNRRLPLSKKYSSFHLAEKILIHFEKKPLQNKESISLEMIEPLSKWKEELQNNVLQHQSKINGEFHKTFFWLNLPISVEHSL